MSDRMISYAQNAEDVVLARAFGAQAGGFFVDVGANEPTHDSVTRHFYDRGWSGINIEPQLSCFDNLQRERERDVNLNIGVGPDPGMLTLHVVPDAPAMSTFSAEQAGNLHAMGYGTVTREVQVRTLDDVFAEHVGERSVDFLKVDVEGLEEGVLGTFDWDRWRPRSVVVESYPDVSAWEERMLARGYHRVLWDGINLFFVRSEDLDELGPKLASPATIVLDRYDPWLYVEQLAATRAKLEPLIEDYLKREFSLRVGAAPDVPAAATALAGALVRRPDVVDAFGAPPAVNLEALLRWAAASPERTEEAAVADLVPFSALYSRIADSPRTAPDRLRGTARKVRDALPPGVQRGIATVRRELIKR